MTQVRLNQRAAVQPWTPTEEKILRQMVADNATRFEIAQRLNRNIESVAGKVQYLGLCKRNATVDLPGEIWKVASRNANYEVSNLGRIRNKHTLREMKLSKDGSGYPQLTLPNGDGTRRTHKVHRLVLETFRPIANCHLFLVNHLNGDKTDASLVNLDWVTQQENNDHAVENGLRVNRSGENHQNAKFTNSQIRRVCELLQDGRGEREIARMVDFAINTLTIRQIRQRKSWRQVSQEYSW